MAAISCTSARKAAAAVLRAQQGSGKGHLLLFPPARDGGTGGNRLLLGGELPLRRLLHIALECFILGLKRLCAASQQAQAPADGRAHRGANAGMMLPMAAPEMAPDRPEESTPPGRIPEGRADQGVGHLLGGIAGHLAQARLAQGGQHGCATAVSASSRPRPVVDLADGRGRVPRLLVEVLIGRAVLLDGRLGVAELPPQPGLLVNGVVQRALAGLVLQLAVALLGLPDLYIRLGDRLFSDLQSDRPARSVPCHTPSGWLPARPGSCQTPCCSRQCFFSVGLTRSYSVMTMPTSSAISSPP